MNIDKISIKKLIPADYNPRKDLRPGDPEYEKLKRSFEEFVFGNRKVQLLAIKSAIASTTIFTSSMNLSCGSFYL